MVSGPVRVLMLLYACPARCRRTGCQADIFSIGSSSIEAWAFSFS